LCQVAEQDKNVAMWMVWETGSKSLREIGGLFGGVDYAAVAQRIRRTKSTYNPIAARRLLTAMLNI
jgi:chromosomal replication initiation ATPase DnaA